jgi:glycosyltransferase involved in cell wall biosynthesis
MGYNLWAKLLWKHGHEAYIVTYDGQYTPWMCDHQPVVSLEEAKRRGADRYATSWVEAKAFIDIAPQVYLADWEPFYSFYALNGATVDLLNANKIKDVCVETRYEQAYWRAVYDIDAHIVPPFCDRRYWRPAPARIISGRLGYFQENDAEGDAARRIGDYLSLETMRMSGTEQEVIDKLQTCDIYLCLNPGKDKYHCEGLARTVLEAMCCGCVVVAYDVGGNREFLIDGYNGFVGEHSVDAVAARVKWLMNSPEQKETLRSRSMDFALNAFTAERTWREMERFLEL